MNDPIMTSVSAESSKVSHMVEKFLQVVSDLDVASKVSTPYRPHSDDSKRQRKGVDDFLNDTL